jgi:3-mercaptopyruvate sulfurtransferase SseA
MGITRVHALLGGFAEWKQRGYALTDALEQIGWPTATTA